MTLPNGHGTCLRHQRYDIGCDDFERLRVRAGDRCEMTDCRIAGPDTKSGQLFIDHEGPIWGPGARVRGLPCCGCNNGLGRVEARPGWHGHRPATDAEAAYLARPFWREPKSVQVQQEKDGMRLHRAWLVDELAKHSNCRRSAFDGMSPDEAIARALDEGVRQAAIVRRMIYPGSRVGKVAKLRRPQAV